MLESSLFGRSLKLLGSTTSPFVRKARVTLLEASVVFEFVPQATWGANDLADYSPVAKVPVLIGTGMDPMFDSGVILSAVLSETKLGERAPTDASGIIELRTHEAVADGLAECSAALTQEGWRERSCRSQFLIDRYQHRIERCLTWLDRAVQNDRDFSLPLSLEAMLTVVAVDFLAFWQGTDWLEPHSNLVRLQAFWQRHPTLYETTPFLPEGAVFPKL